MPQKQLFPDRVYQFLEIGGRRFGTLEEPPESPEAVRPAPAFTPGVALVALLIGVLAYDVYKHLASDTGDNNVHAHQAAAFLKGRLALDRRLHDTVVYRGEIYSHFPPFPAVVLMPFVAAFGLSGTNPFAVKMLLTAVNILLLWAVLRRLRVGEQIAGWLVVGFFAGTAYWPTLTAEGVWYYAQIVAVTCLLLALHEALGKARGLVVGLFLGAAILSRQMAVYSGLFLAVLLWVNYRSEFTVRRLANLAVFGLTMAATIGLYLWLNALRFDDPFDSGYKHLQVGEVWTRNIERFGLFSLAYVPFNLLQMFVQGFHFQLLPDKLQMDPNGTSITFASPFVFCALFAVWHKRLALAAWVSILLTLVHLLVYYSNGWVQANAQRYTLDFLPVLVLLVALGMKHVPATVWKIAISYSVVLNFLAVVILPRSWSLLTRYCEVAIGP